ncbi:MAG: ABC transporter permease subunit/CPBP intramembrane protease [Planctomycetota bacterium]
MNWTNVFLLLSRELRDQLRDRRTLFTVVVLPLLLYPLMGISMLQITQFFREHPTKVWVVGHENLSGSPPFLQAGRIASDWLDSSQARLLEVQLADRSGDEFQRLVGEFKRDNAGEVSQALVNAYIQQELKRRDSDLAVLVPKPLDFQLNAEQGVGTSTPAVYLFLNTSSDRSRVAAERFLSAANNWKNAVRDESLREANLSPRLVEPFVLRSMDIADGQGRRAAAWSRILPMLLMIWSLTGAFYPAVDLCAGEKERGTLETLLSCPASRSEIAIGKLLTVMIFSFATCLLNFMSLGITSFFVIAGNAAKGGFGPLGGMELPPTQSLIWLLVATVPIAALFSALSLAAAAFARSSKEGQYYLVPLIMICLPLMAIPMFPATRLELGTSLIPVTGLMLLLRCLIEGQVSQVLQYCGPVFLVTVAGCWLAVRWVVIQFNSETVLFRASERFSLRNWLTRAFLQRQELPSVGQALLCAVTILVVKFFAGFAISMPTSFSGFALQTVIILFATVFMPALLMAMFLTKRPDWALKVKSCRPAWIAAAVLIGISLNPLFTWLSGLVLTIYPMNDSVQQLQSIMATVMSGAPGLVAIVVVLAVLPAAFEELAFRGFILSGMQRMKSSLGAVIASSFFFALAHAVFQQSVLAFVAGLIFGVIAWRTQSILPCIACHAMHNSMSILLGELKVGGWGAFQWLVYESERGVTAYRIAPALLLTMLGVTLLYWLFQQTSAEPVGEPSERDAKRSLSPRLATPAGSSR